MEERSLVSEQYERSQRARRNISWWANWLSIFSLLLLVDQLIVFAVDGNVENVIDGDGAFMDMMALYGGLVFVGLQMLALYRCIANMGLQILHGSCAILDDRAHQITDCHPDLKLTPAHTQVSFQVIEQRTTDDIHLLRGVLKRTWIFEVIPGLSMMAILMDTFAVFQMALKCESVVKIFFLECSSHGKPHELVYPLFYLNILSFLTSNFGFIEVLFRSVTTNSMKTLRTTLEEHFIREGSNMTDHEKARYTECKIHLENAPVIKIFGFAVTRYMVWKTMSWYASLLLVIGWVVIGLVPMWLKFANGDDYHAILRIWEHAKASFPTA